VLRRIVRGVHVKRRCLGRIGALAVLIACGLASVLAVVASAVPTHPRLRAYSITDLGTLGGSLSWSFAINDRGRIVGDSSLSGDTTSHAFLYKRGRMIDLLPGPANSFATDINNRGEVVGTLGVRAFVYRRGRVTQISLGGPTSTAFGINDRGDVVGWSELAAGRPNVFHAFLYRDGRTIDLTPNLPADRSSIAHDINDRGVVVGHSFHLFRFESRPFLWRNGTLSDLNLALSTSEVGHASDINNAGDVAGNSSSTAPPNLPTAVLLRRGRLMSLGRGPAIAMNNRGHVVGVGPGGPFLWEKGTRIELNTVIPPSSGWTILTLEDINDRGQIVGAGFHNGAQHAFLLSPKHDDDDDD
jgi:probable HAF family extracellular repeat protein